MHEVHVGRMWPLYGSTIRKGLVMNVGRYLILTVVFELEVDTLHLTPVWPLFSVQWIPI